MSDTTRRYPRTLQQAFPRDRQWAYSIEKHRAPMGLCETVVAWAAITGMSVLIAWAVVS